MPRRDAAANRAALLEAARLELNRDPEASLETIALAAGLSRRSVYSHFRSRDELRLELLRQGIARVTAAFAAPPHADPVVDLCLIAATLWREVESARLMTLFALRGPFKQLTAEALAGLRERALDDVRRGQATGGVRDDIAADTLAHLLESGIVGVLDEASREHLGDEATHGVLLRLVLGLLGHGWREAAALIDTRHELDWTA
ncbi:MAG: TetR/AcrR family transcriptional regulator [Microbacteriaceae bacterium]